MNKAKQKQEAIKRMRLLHLHENVIKEFEQEGVINLSECGGMLYWLDEKQRAMVEEFETEHNAVVYHVIHDFTEFGELYAMLYVSQYDEEWDYDKDDIKSNIALAYVKNVTDDWCSEFGSIGVRPQFGGLVRTA